MKSIIASIVFVLMLQTIAAAQEGLNDSSRKKNLVVQCPDTVPSTGKYENGSYDFSIVIPKSFKAYWNSARCVPDGDDCVCMSDHGRIIPLTAEPYEPERHIEVYAGYTLEPDATIQDEVNDRIKAIRKAAARGSVTIRRRSKLTIAGLAAERAVVHYYDPTLKKTMIEDFIETRYANASYSLYLRTPAKAYTADAKIFEAVTESFTVERTGLR